MNCGGDSYTICPIQKSNPYVRNGDNKLCVSSSHDNTHFHNISLNKLYSFGFQLARRKRTRFNKLTGALKHVLNTE